MVPLVSQGVHIVSVYPTSQGNVNSCLTPTCYQPHLLISLYRKVVPGCPGLQSQHPICYAWNEDPTPGCPHYGCRFEHICYLCSKDVRVQNKGHKSNPLPSSHLGQINKATKACLLLLTNHPSISKR